MWNHKPDFDWPWKSIKNSFRNFTNNRKVKKMALPVRRDTKHLHWIHLRTAVDSSDSPVPLGVGTSKIANIPDHAKMVALGMNVTELRFLASADGASCTAYVYAVRKDDDPCLVCSIAITAGKQVATDGQYYADTLAITDYWFEGKEIKKADADGADRMARVAFDFLGYDKLFVLLDISTGTWGIDFTGF